MSKQLQLRRGTTAQHSTFTGAIGEVTADITKKTLVVHDGATQGGFPLAKEADLVKYVRHDINDQNLTSQQQANARTNIGLGNVNNTSDADKPISNATQAALNQKLNTSGGTMTGPITLHGDAAAPLHAVPKQQAEAIAASVAQATVSEALANYTPPTSTAQRGVAIFTSSGTFTVPSGVTAVYVKMCGGGGGSGNSARAGGTSSFGGYCTATGGPGASTSGGGSGSGMLVLPGGKGAFTSNGSVSGGACGGGNAGESARAGMMGGDSGYGAAPASGFGNGAPASYNENASIFSGTGAGYVEHYVTGLTPGQQIAVTVGGGGAAGYLGQSGRPGIVYVFW